MILRFPYLGETVASPPPSLSSTPSVRWRPLVPVTLFGPTGRYLSFGRALVDSGADDTVFPLELVELLDIALYPPTGHRMRWRGERFALRYGNVQLELVDDDGEALRWSAVIAFATASLRYPLLGVRGCLEFMDLRLLGADRMIELQPNRSYPGSPRA